ncbi:MAG: TonB-dependent receptor [Acidobacteriia bacterium]|nr:TonB-dependent receptor [Terriglobia bacterium]
MRFIGSNRLLTLLAIIVVTPLLWAQETTAGLQGVVKDKSGALIAGANIEIKGPSLLGSKTAVTDSAGFYRVTEIPAGTYSVSVNAKGFRPVRLEGIVLATGRLPNVDVQLEVGATNEVVEVTGAAPLVDVAQSKVQTNVTQDILASVATGRSFQSVIQFAPGARAEPLQGGPNNGSVGYQIDGSGNSENSYLVEGQETADVQNGAANTNVPMEFIQEVVVKTSGFEAEHGGALGGVINVIQKRGSNTWHGSVFSYYEGDSLDSAPDQVLRRDPTTAATGDPSGTPTPFLDQTAQYVQPKKDHYRLIDPGFEAGGALMKDRLWVFLSSVPRLERRERTVNMTTGLRTFLETNDTYYSLARLDARVSDKIRVFGSWQYDYEKGHGANFAGGLGPLTLTLPNADYVYGGLNTTAGNNPDNYNIGIGFVRPSVIYNVGGDINFNPNVVFTARFGRVYNDYQDRGIPQGIRYFYRDTTYPYATGNAPAAANLTSLDGQTLGVAAPESVQSTAFTNIGDNTATLFNPFDRKSFNADIAVFKKGFGAHNFKGGFGLNRLSNNTSNGYNTADVYVGFGLAWSPSLSSPACTDANGDAIPCPADQRTAPGEHCADVEAENAAMFGAVAGAGTCRGNWGTVNLRELGTTGKAASKNYALYVQDAWTVGHGVTLNLGVRFDKEHVPTFVEGNPGISFGFTDKVAPRLGASWDVLQNGKVKLYGSFGYFFDIMKYELPRGSFGGDYWHDCAYAVDDPHVFTAILPLRGSDGHYCPRTGAAEGTITGARFIANEDFRLPVNDVSQGPSGLIDPHLKPMKQHEMVVGADWALARHLALETRYSRKRLDDTIEDAGTILPNGEQYYLVNPGKGLNATKCDGCPPNPIASRRYDGVEFRLTKATSANWFGAVSYTYSRLRGNYSGLTATDVSDGGGGRQGSNTSRAFDEPFMSFDAHGKVIDGPEATDRPHGIKGFGYYRLKWWKMETLLGGYQVWYSGSPLTSYMSVWGAPVFVEGRGNFVDVTRDPTTGDFVLGGVHSRRTPSFSQTDASIVNEFGVSKTNEALKLGFEVNILNLFNQHSPTFFDTNLVRTGSVLPPLDYQVLETGAYNYIDAANGTAGYGNTHRVLNSMYGLPYGWQSPRGIRMKVKFVF